MNELITTFHIDWKLLIAQIINFAIVLLVLWQFALKPLSKTMTARTKKITKSLEDAKKIEENLKKTEEEHGARINQAKKEAQVILAEANKQAEKQREETIALAKKESAKIVQETRGTIAQEKDKMISEVREEVAELITGSVGQILGKNIHLELDEKIIKEAIKKIR